MKKIKKLWAKVQEKLYAWLDRNSRERAVRWLGPTGRMLGQESTYRVMNPTHITQFNAGLVLGRSSLKTKLFGKRLIWFGDMDLTRDMDALIALARSEGDTLQVVNAVKVPVLTVTSRGNENQIDAGFFQAEIDSQGLYVYPREVAQARNRPLAAMTLATRGYLPDNDLYEFYDLPKPRPARKARAKARKRAKKRA